MDGNINNLCVDNYTTVEFSDIRRNAVARRKVSDSLVNTMLANCGLYSSDYIAEALSLSGKTVTDVIFGNGPYKGVGDRALYAGNIRSAR